jgi:hypothetical protein
MIDFSPIARGDIKLLEFSQGFGVADLKQATNDSIDFMLGLTRDLTDAQAIFLPHDPEANDPYAKPGEENIGWSVAHLIVHVTASSEEWATYSSILARGMVYPAEPRLRYETEWTTVKTTAECIQRLEESRRIRLSYLNAWPDQPHLEVLRQLSPRYVEKFGEMNATAGFLFGLMHEVNHHAQMQEARRQALAADLAAV